MVHKSYYVITRTFKKGIFDDDHESKNSVIARKVKKTRRTRIPRSPRSHVLRKDRRVSFDDAFGFEDDFFESKSKMKRYMKNNNLTDILNRKW